jgi:CRP/FNR family transcriptional regulator, cyclic AMP receptor protein
VSSAALLLRAECGVSVGRMNSPQLATLPLFASLSKNCRARLAESARRVRFEAGEEIVREQSLSFEFFAIEEGTAEVLNGDEHVADLGPGEFFGEMGVLPHGALRFSRRNATVVARTPVDCIAIPGHEFRQAVEDMPELRDAILAAVAERRRAADAPS